MQSTKMQPRNLTATTPRSSHNSTLATRA